jgi:plasmid stabilization system protein ParE
MAGRLARMSPAARVWFLAEIAYVAERNPAAAERIIAAMRAARQTMAEHPGLGRPGQIPGTRRFVVGPYVLTLVRRGEDIEIVAIRHGRQRDAHAPDETAG